MTNINNVNICFKNVLPGYLVFAGRLCTRDVCFYSSNRVGKCLSTPTPPTHTHKAHEENVKGTILFYDIVTHTCLIASS